MIRAAHAGDVAAPFQEFVVKIFERCNLTCRYCYMYELADQSWRSRPTKMSAETMENFIDRVVEHVSEHDLRSITVTLHGGEPLLRGREFIGWAISKLRHAIPQTDLDARIQTNGVLLDLANLRVLADHRIGIGVSLDGPKASNDLSRLDRRGNSSFEAVCTGIDNLRSGEFVHLFRSILSTIDLRSDATETVEFLTQFAPPSIDFLLPHATWDSLPALHDSPSPTPYGDWLVAAFDGWYGKCDQTTEVRLFHNIIVGLMGGRSEVDSIGTSPVRTIFVDTDGSIQQIDTLKVAFEGASETGLTIFDNRFDDALHHPGIIARQRGVDALSLTCRRCDLVQVCGGGHYAHRFRTGNDFDNPSVFCQDLTVLIRHIQGRIAADLGKSLTA